MSLQRVNITHLVGDEHGPVFAELVTLLTHSLELLGLQVGYSVNQVVLDALNIVVGPAVFLGEQQLAVISNARAPYVVFQVESLDPHHSVVSKVSRYMDFLRSAPHIWDYSSSNVSFLRELGCADVRYIPLGYSSRLEQIAFDQVRDIDVLFFGSITPRRRRLLDELERRGVRVRPMFGVYGSTRDRAIGQSKIVLNMHQFEWSQLEQLRIAYLLNNRCFVVSETADCNPYGEGAVFCDYEGLADCCEHFLRPGMELERDRIAQAGYGCLKTIPTLQNIQAALGRFRDFGAAAN